MRLPPISIYDQATAEAEIARFNYKYIQQEANTYFNYTSVQFPLPFTVHLPIIHQLPEGARSRSWLCPAGLDGFEHSNEHGCIVGVNLIDSKFSPYLTPKMRAIGTYSHTIMARELQISIQQLRSLMRGPQFPSLETYLRFLCLAQFGETPTRPPESSWYHRSPPDEHGESSYNHHRPFPGYLHVAQNLYVYFEQFRSTGQPLSVIVKNAGISHPTLLKIEDGIEPTVNLKTILKLAYFFSQTNDRSLEEVMNSMLSTEIITRHTI